jgi:putative glutamine amidotransferase
MKPPHGHHPLRRPVIALTPDVADGTELSPFSKAELKASYTDAVVRAGGLPIILPVTDDQSMVEAYLDRVAGVVVTGGAFDVPPSLYGEASREGLGPLKPQRTEFELMVIKTALAKQLPLLGICGGMQLLNVAYGGTLIQDIAREMPSARLHEQKHVRTQPQHPVEVKEGSVLADCVGKGQLMVNSTHHQAIKTLGAGLLASAHAPDGIIEAIEHRGPGFVVGVQWHPEMMVDTVPPHLGLYRTFVAKARDRRH